MRTLMLALIFVIAGCAEAGVATPRATEAPVDEPVIVTLEPTEEPVVEETTPAPEPTPAQPEEFKPGEPVTVTQGGTDWATIVVDRVKQVKKYEGGYFDDVPKRGNVYIQLRVTYTAIVDGVDYNPFDWQIFVGGEAGGDYTYVSNGPTPGLEAGTLPKGRTAQGYLVYEIKAKGKVLLSYGGTFSNQAPVFEVVLRAK